MGKWKGEWETVRTGECLALIGEALRFLATPPAVRQSRTLPVAPATASSE
jgi:hypothetical protein